MNPALKTLLLGISVSLLLGGIAGWSLAARHFSDAPPAPEDWLARVDDSYITTQDFLQEMERRGGRQAGQYQTLEQRRQLLDDLVYRRALVAAAEQDGLLQRPELRRDLEQVISNHYLQQTLRAAEREVRVEEAEIERFHQQHADDYVVPARKRIAMLRQGLSASATESDWQAAEQRLLEAKARVEDESSNEVPHFGALAREYSDDPGSRYRGGVIGWISEGASSRYNFDPVVLEASRQLETAGHLSAVLRGRDAVYLVRLVESEARRTRSFEQLADGIRQRILKERLDETARNFRQRLLKQVGVRISEARLADIAPLSEPGKPQPPQPPAMPQDQG